MFRGASQISIDEKGRLSIPTRYRDTLQQDCGGAMVCTIDLKQPCLLLYPIHEWELIEKKLMKLSSMNPHERRLQRLLLGHANEGDMDKSGRLLIPSPLRKHASLSKQVMLVGQLNKFEIWDTEAWQQQIDQDIDTELDGEFPISERLMDFSL